MTKRAYHDNGALSCQAMVLDCVAVEGGYEILTDVTAIFPESGGQLSDTGRIGDAVISHAREEGELVWHMADRPLEKGAVVTVTADAEPRIDHTCQHSGEHILSGLASKLFGAVNVGFHMAEDYATIDLDTFLTHEQIQQLQREANRAVQRNVPVTSVVVRGEELENMPLRKQAKGLTGDIRIVYFEDGAVDSCTCCGTHVAYSGEVGYIKITSHIKYKGGVRIWFACGMRAVEDSLKNQDIVDSLAVRFSAKAEDVVSAVIRQGDELNAAKHQLRERTQQLQKYISAELLQSAESIGGARLVVSLQQGARMNELKTLAEKLTEQPEAVAVLFSLNGETLMYQLARGKAVKNSMRELIQAVNAAVGGKGGGRDEFAQGSAAVGGATDVEGTVEQIRSYCRAVLKG
ncbi:MAG: DHHA1 domain-containing protein [Christensenellales bacterium]